MGAAPAAGQSPQALAVDSRDLRDLGRRLTPGRRSTDLTSSQKILIRTLLLSLEASLYPIHNPWSAVCVKRLVGERIKVGAQCRVCEPDPIPQRTIQEAVRWIETV